MKLPFGKIPLEVLKKSVLGYTGFGSSDVIIGPELGVDFGVIKIGQQYLIVSSDPITGTDDEIGWYSVNSSANDVATSGSRPRFLTSVLLLPYGANYKSIEAIAKQIDNAAKNLEITVLGGHTEITPGIQRSIAIITAFGITDRYVTAKGAKEGDAILMTKTAGIEGTSILSRLFKNNLDNIENELLNEASLLISKISVVKESLEIFSTGGINAMHDPTEGGILGGLYEMSIGSGIGFSVKIDNIPVARSTSAICSNLNIDPLKLAGSGALLAAVKPEYIDIVLKKLENIGIQGNIIGRFRGKNREYVKGSGSIKEAETQISDELWRLVGKRLP